MDLPGPEPTSIKVETAVTQGMERSAAGVPVVYTSVRLLLLLVAALVPALIVPGVSFYFDITPKVVLLLAGTAFVLAAWNGSMPRLRGDVGWVVALLGVEALWLGVATTFSTHPALSLNGGNWRRFGLIVNVAVLVYALLVISDCSGRPARINDYLRAIVATGIPIAAYGIAQYLGFDPWLPSASYQAGEAPFTIVRPPATLGHAGYFGTYLVYVALAGAGLLISDRFRTWKIVGGSAFLICSAAMIMSGTRAAFAGLVVGSVVLLVRFPDFRAKRYAVFAAVFLASMAALFLSPPGARLRSRVHWSLEEPLGGARPLLWRDTLNMASHRLATGFGPETFGTEFPRYQSADLARVFPDFQHESPHNVFLDILTSQGLPALIILASILALTLHRSFSANGNAVLGAALAGGLVAQQFNALTVPTALATYLFIALIVSGHHDIAVTAQPARMWPRWIAAAAAIVFLAYAGKLAIADRELAMVRDAVQRADLGQTLAHYEAAQRWEPAGSSADLYASRELANLFRRTADVRVKMQTWTPAFRAATKAVSTSEERQNAFYNLAMFFATQNDAANVERSLRNAIFWAPNWFKPHWALSRLLAAQGRLNEAASEGRLAVNLNGGKDAEVARTLEKSL